MMRAVCIAALVLLLALSAAADDTRDLARDSYREFLRLAPLDDPRRASALRRLADIELERAELVQLESDDLDEATPIYDRAIDLYQDLLRSFPDFAGNDGVMYQLARAFEQRGDVAQAVAQLGVLTTDYPQSPYIIESHFRRGEAAFSATDYDLAAAAYAKILARDDAQDSTFYQQALYKLGWSQFRLGEYPVALDAFLVLLNHELAPGGAYDRARHEGLARGKRALIKDTLRAMSMSYSYLGGVQALNALLARGHAPGFEFLLYQDLGEHFLGQERFADAAATFGAFVADFPNDTHAPHLQLKVIDTYRAAGFAERELAAKETFVERYALTDAGGYWQTHTRAAAAQVVSALKLHLGELSAHYHAQAQTAPAAVGRAEHFYREWLASFPDDPQASATQFLLAELLFSHERFAAATTAYEAAAYDYGEHPRAGEAGYASLLAYAAHANTLPEGELTAWQRRGINAALRFAASFPTHVEANNVLVNAAERLFELGEFERASNAAQVLLQLQPPASVSHRRTAWTVVGHASFDTGSFANAEQAYGEVLALSAPDAGERAAITERLAAAVYKQGEQRRASGDLAGAVEAFLRVARVAPGAAIRATADYDAAAALIELQDWARAATALEGFRATHSGHELASEVTRSLASVYLKAGRQAEAASQLDRIAADSQFAQQTRRDASRQAADLYKAINDPAGEARNQAYFLSTLASTLDERTDTRERLAQLALASGDRASRDTYLRQIISAHDAATQPTARSLSAAANAALTLADDQWDGFANIALVVPLKDSLRLKKTTMERLLDAYGKAADYAVGAVTTAATYRIGELYREMGAALLDSQRPPQLSDLELEEYEFLLEEQAFPFEEKAIEIHEANARRSAQGVYDEWVQRSFTQLARLLPARYAKFEKGEAYATLYP